MAATGMVAVEGRFAITGPSAALLFFNLLDGIFTLTFLIVAYLMVH